MTLKTIFEAYWSMPIGCRSDVVKLAKELDILVCDTMWALNGYDQQDGPIALAADIDLDINEDSFDLSDIDDWFDELTDAGIQEVQRAFSKSSCPDNVLVKKVMAYQVAEVHYNG